MKDLTCSVYTFEKLIDGNFLYVDKTEYLWKLIRPASAMYFMSRPRRFGKSLTLSTLKAVFEGKKELFKGLAIYEKPYDWNVHPIIHLDFADRKTDSLEEFETSLQVMLGDCARQYGIALTTDNAQEQFSELVKRLSVRGEVVILVDEYDKPILDNLGRKHVARILEKLSNFYSVIKATEPLQRFVFMTGVSKFTHVSIFSKLNSLNDITMNAEFADMFGYTQEELENNFAERIRYFADKLAMSRESFLLKMKEWYNGYRFHADMPTVYNPVSVAAFFINQCEFNNYWFRTGTPTFLLELMKKTNFNYAETLSKPESPAFFDSFEISNLKPKVLLYQTGYLTIDKCTREAMPYTDILQTYYHLHFPNLEVEKSFNEQLLEYYATLQTNDAPLFFGSLIEAVGSGNVDAFMTRLQTLFANIPYNIHVKNEHYYQTIMYVVFDMLHLWVEAEVCTNDGRLDMMVSAGEWIYVIEFKLNHSATEALSQIQNRNYALKYRNRGKRLMLIGVNFDFGKGQISDWLAEEYKG